LEQNEVRLQPDKPVLRLLEALRSPHRAFGLWLDGFFQWWFWGWFLGLKISPVRADFLYLIQ